MAMGINVAKIATEKVPGNRNGRDGETVAGDGLRRHGCRSERRKGKRQEGANSRTALQSGSIPMVRDVPNFHEDCGNLNLVVAGDGLRRHGCRSERRRRPRRGKRQEGAHHRTALQAVRFPYEAGYTEFLGNLRVVEQAMVAGDGLRRQDAGANAAGGPEGVSARMARIIEPRFKAVRFPCEAGSAAPMRAIEVIGQQWWPGTESNRRHGDFQSPALPTELPGPCACVPGR